MRLVDLLGARNPGVVRRHRDAALGIGQHADGVDHVSRRQLVAVVESDVGAQLEFQRRGVDPFPRLGDQRLHHVTVGIAIDEAVPGVMRDDEAGAQRVVVGIDVVDLVAPVDAQRVGGFLGAGRRAGEQRAGGQGGGG